MNICEILTGVIANHLLKLLLNVVSIRSVHILGGPIPNRDGRQYNAWVTGDSGCHKAEPVADPCQVSRQVGDFTYVTLSEQFGQKR